MFQHCANNIIPLLTLQINFRKLPNTHTQTNFK